MNGKETDVGARPRKILAIVLTVTNALEKSAHMCVLKYLRRRGWDVTVLTVDKTGAKETYEEDWCGIRIVRVVPGSWRWRMLQPVYRARRTGRATGLGAFAGKMLNRAFLPVTLALSFPDRFVAARQELLEHALWLDQREHFDAVVSLYHPLSAHYVARALARVTARPWIALTKDFYSWPDSLDHWSGGRMINRLKRKYESRVLRGCRSLLTVSDYMTAYYRDVFPQLDVQTLPHCFDEEVFPADAKNDVCSDLFRLVSVGVITKHDEAALADLFQVLGELLNEGVLDAENFRVRFVGHGLRVVRSLARQYRCTDLLETRETVPHEEAIHEMCQATCLFVKRHEWDAKRRLTEYIATRRPILAFPSYSGHMTNKVLQDYGAARIAGDKESLKTAIREIYAEYQATGRLNWPVNPETVQQQTARQRAKELEGFLLESINGTSDPVALPTKLCMK